MIVGIIPARGGSVRLPHKNKLSFRGKPLIVWTIEAALASNVCDRVLVSSDDDEILYIARTNNAEAWKRPVFLSNGNLDGPHILIRYIVERQLGLNHAGIILLQPTSPLRTAKDIQQAHKIYDPLGGTCDSVTSVCPEWESTTENPMRENGAIYITSSIVCGNGSIYGKRLRCYAMPTERSTDINTQSDFEVAERLASDNYRVLHQLDRSGRSAADDTGSQKRKPGRPRKVPAI